MTTSPQNNNIDVVSEIKHRLNIIDVVSEHVVLKKQGRNFWGCCPFHQEKTPSFSVSPEKGIYKCFGCGAGGDAISFLMGVTKQSFVEVVSELAQQFGLEFKASGNSSQNVEIKKQIIDANNKAAKYFLNLLLTSDEAQKAKNYLNKRNLTEEVFKEYQIGFATKQPDGLIQHLTKKHNFKIDLLDKAGLVSKKSTGNGYVDRFRNRIIIPIQNENGDVIAFGARAIDEGQNPKYLNSADTLAYNKSRTLYGIHKAKEAIKTEDSVIVMEGYFDVITAQIHGVKNTVASCGTALTESHLKLLSKYMFKNKIYLAFDSDKAGIQAADRGAEVIKETFSGLGEIKQFDESFSSTSNSNKFSCEIRVVNADIGKDPDEFIRTEGAEAYKEFINAAPLLIDYQINRIIKSKGEIKTPQEKSQITRELIPILSEINNSIIKNEYIKLVSDRLKIDENALLSETNKSVGGTKNHAVIKQPIVKKSLQKHIFAQKNLLSLYLINSDKLSFSCLNEYLKDLEFTEANLIDIKESIEKISNDTNDSEELSNKLFAYYADNEEIKQILVELNFSLDDKKSMDANLLKQYIQENIACILRIQKQAKQNELKTQYHTVNSDEASALQLQYKVREQIKLNRHRLELLNGEKK